MPKGTSAYQAAWIVESDEEDEGKEEALDEMEEKDFMDDIENNEEPMEEENKNEKSEDEEEMQEFQEANKLSDLDKEMDQLEEERRKKYELSEEDLQFPDEVNAPINTPAKTRFQKYRGLKSFRTSPWDPKENLPSSYSRIFQFENFKKTQKRILKESTDMNKKGMVEQERYITLHIANVPEAMFKEKYNPKKLLLITGLLQFENKLSTIHFKILKHPSYQEPIQSKVISNFWLDLNNSFLFF